MWQCLWCLLSVIIVILVNKRLDEWVPENYLDTRKVQFPRKDGTTTGQNTGATTPKKHLQNIGGIALNSVTISSRPSSPKLDNDNELVNGSAVMAAALQKKINRKRKVSILYCHLGVVVCFVIVGSLYISPVFYFCTFFLLLILIRHVLHFSFFCMFELVCWLLHFHITKFLLTRKKKSFDFSFREFH